MQNVLSSLSSLKTFVKDATDYNSATLSGAVDVVAVKHDDGSYRSTPWHVRFGKFQVFRSSRKPVKIFVNDQEAPFQMKLGSEGAAYFVQESDEPVDNADYITSPLGSPLSSPEMSPQPSPRSQPDETISAFDLEAADPSSSAEPPKARRSMSDGELAKLLDEPEPRSHSGGGSRPGSSSGRTQERGSLSEYLKRAMSIGRSKDSDDDDDDDDDDNAAATFTTEPGVENSALSSAINLEDVMVDTRPAPVDLFGSPSRERSISMSKPWSSYDAQQAVADFVYPSSLQPVHMKVRNTFEQTIAVSSAFQAIVWNFTTESYNIGFSVEFHVSNEETGAHEAHVVLPPRRVDSHKAPQKGLFLSPCAGILLLKWDNTFSKLRNKKLKYTVYLVGSLPNIDPSATTPISSKAFATVAASSSSDPPAGSIPHSVHFPVETPFGTGRLAIPCTETSPSVGIHLDTGSASGHHVVCYCDRSRVRPVEQTVAAADSIAARARPASTRSPSHSEDELTTSDNARARSRSNSSSSSAAVSSIHESSSVPNFITYAWDHKIGQWVLSEGGEYLSPLGSVSRTARSSATVSPLASPVGPKAQARPRREDSYSSVVTESSSRPASSRGRGAAAGGGTASESDDNVSTATSREPSSSQKQQQQQQQQRHFKKSVVPTSEQIAQLPLKAGSNTLAFEVYSRLQGRSRIEATLFLWSPTAKVVISDVDGTITKSDVMGHVMFMIGRDWTHNGVAPLYAKIAENGYKFVYLTSRNIGQVDNTKMYLRNISQNQCKLPPGAVITSPDRLFAALNREMVQRRPQEFKITALRDVRHCFPNTHNPFYAGFGNRATDVVSYRAVGVAEGRIYIINPAGEIRHFNHMYRASYTSLQELVDVMFPAFSDGSEGDSNAGARKFQDASFSSYNYWKSNPFQFDDV